MPTPYHEKNAELLLHELHEEGELISQGLFTLDAQRASEKVNRFGLKTPYLFGVELIAGAVLNEAESFHISLSVPSWLYNLIPKLGYKLTMQFDGAPYTQEQLEQLDTYLFSNSNKPDELRLIKLAKAIYAAKALKPLYLTFSSSTAQGRTIKLIYKNNSFTIKPIKRTRTKTTFNKLELKLPPPKTNSRNPRSGRPTAGQNPAVKLIKAYCRCHKPSIYIERKLLDTTLQPPPSSLTSLYFRHPNFPLPVPAEVKTVDSPLPAGILFWLPDNFSASTKLVFLRHGIIIEEKDLSWRKIGLIVYINTTSLNTDLTGNSVIEDDHYNKFLGELKQLLYSSLGDWAQEQPPTEAKQKVNTLLRDSSD